MQQNFQILGKNYYQNQLLNNLAEKNVGFINIHEH